MNFADFPRVPFIRNTIARHPAVPAHLWNSTSMKKLQRLSMIQSKRSIHLKPAKDFRPHLTSLIDVFYKTPARRPENVYRTPMILRAP